MPHFVRDDSRLDCLTEIVGNGRKTFHGFRCERRDGCWVRTFFSEELRPGMTFGGVKRALSPSEWGSGPTVQHKQKFLGFPTLNGGLARPCGGQPAAVRAECGDMKVVVS